MILLNSTNYVTTVYKLWTYGSGCLSLNNNVLRVYNGDLLFGIMHTGFRLTALPGLESNNYISVEKVFPTITYNVSLTPTYGLSLTLSYTTAFTLQSYPLTSMASGDVVMSNLTTIKGFSEVSAILNFNTTTFPYVLVIDGPCTSDTSSYTYTVSPSLPAWITLA